MTDAAYWKERCQAAERALQLARRGLHMSKQRRSVLALLADLKAGAHADTHFIARVLRCKGDHAYEWLRAMEDLGLVERTPGTPGRRGTSASWRLGHLVHVEAPE
jgi:Fe2+ or Zn2+ uptake regulation protein